MIVLVVALSITNLHILTATEPTSPAAEPGLNRALTWVSVTGGICILIGLGILFKLPRTINKPLQTLTDLILEIANHNYDIELNLTGSRELEDVSRNFNRMTNHTSKSMCRISDGASTRVIKKASSNPTSVCPVRRCREAVSNCSSRRISSRRTAVHCASKARSAREPVSSSRSPSDLPRNTPQKVRVGSRCGLFFVRIGAEVSQMTDLQPENRGRGLKNVVHLVDFSPFIYV